MPHFRQFGIARGGKKMDYPAKCVEAVTQPEQPSKIMLTVTGLVSARVSQLKPVAAVKSSDQPSNIPPGGGPAVQAAALDLVVERLVADLRPVADPPVARRLAIGLGAGVALSVLLIGITLGYRPDMATASLTTIFWVKLAYVAGIGAIALWAVERLVRPGVPTGNLLLWLLVPTLALAALAVVQLANGPADMRAHLIMGFSATAAPWRILAPRFRHCWAWPGRCEAWRRRAWYSAEPWSVWRPGVSARRPIPCIARNRPRRFC